MHVLTHHLSGIDLFLRIDEELATVLKMVDGVGIGIAALQGNHGAVDPALYLPLVGLVLLEAVCHDCLALRCCKHIGTQTDYSTRRHVELNVHTVCLRLHGSHLALASCHHVYHLRGELLWHVDGKLFYRLTLLSVKLLVDNLRLSNLQLIALTAHRLNQD